MEAAASKNCLKSLHQWRAAIMPSKRWSEPEPELMKRLDEALVERQLCDSREKAKRAVLAGHVRINDRRAEKASQRVKETDSLSIDQPERFVSRGGYKLEHAV